MLKWTEMEIKLSGIPLGTSLKDIIILKADILVYLSNLSNHWPFEMVITTTTTSTTGTTTTVIIIIYDEEVGPQRG